MSELDTTPAANRGSTNELFPADYTTPEYADYAESHRDDVSVFPFSGELVQNNVANVANVATTETHLDTAKSVIERVLLVCHESPGLLHGNEFIQAVIAIREYPPIWAEYRVKIKKAIPSGVLLSGIDDATSTPGDKEGSDSAAAELIELVLSKGDLVFDAKADKAFVSVDKNGVIDTLALGSKPFIDWLSYEYYSSTKSGGRNGKSASEASIKQASFALSGIARHEGQQQRVYLRMADFEGGHCIFIGDERLRVIEVTAKGWHILDDAPVKFYKPASMQGLPIPQRGGNLSLVWDFINIPEKDRPLVLAWMLEAMRTETPKPILALAGEHGCVKTSTQDKIRELIDNNSSNCRAAPKSVEDFFVGAGLNWLISYENVSHLSAPMQDAFCTTATGGGFAARTLYTNAEETIIDVKRPIIVNSIPNVITAQDLTDRAISIELPKIEYLEEAELNAKWKKAKASIMGGLMDLFVETLAQLPKVVLINPPRMADFTRLGEAMMQAQGHKAGTFDALYKANRAEGIGRAMESSSAAVAVREMVDDYYGISATVFHGTVKDLLTRLADKYRHDADGWPKSPKGLADALRRQSQALATMGIDIVLGRKVERIDSSRGIPVTIRKSGNIGNIGNVISDLSAPKGEGLHMDSVAFNDTEEF